MSRARGKSGIWMRLPVVVLAVLLGACGRSTPETRWIEVKQEIRADFPRVDQMSTTELKQILAAKNRVRPLLLDVREEREFEVSHLRGAHRAEDEDTALRILANEDRDRLIVAYCSVGYRSSVLVKALTKEGFTNVHNLEGSIFEWANRGNPVFRYGIVVKQVHPYDESWGELLDASLRGDP